jgi:hypothetical protein
VADGLLGRRPPGGDSCVQISARLGEVGVQLERAAEPRQRLRGLPALELEHAQVVPGDEVAGRQLEDPLEGGAGILEAPLLHAQVPQVAERLEVLRV